MRQFYCETHITNNLLLQSGNRHCFKLWPPAKYVPRGKKLIRALCVLSSFFALLFLAAAARQWLLMLMRLPPQLLTMASPEKSLFRPIQALIDQPYGVPPLIKSRHSEMGARSLTNCRYRHVDCRRLAEAVKDSDA